MDMERSGKQSLPAVAGHWLFATKRLLYSNLSFDTLHNQKQAFIH